MAPATAFTHAPKGYSFTEAATLTTAGVTAWRALVVDGALKAGDTVLVLGTGGVSIFALQIAKAMGATVVATSSSDEKLERARALGADHTINYRQHPDWGARVWQWTGGSGVDHVVEVGGPGTLAQSITAVAIGGHIALIGVLTGRAGEIPTAQLAIKQVRLQGLIVGSRKHQTDFIRAIDATGVQARRRSHSSVSTRSLTHSDMKPAAIISEKSVWSIEQATSLTFHLVLFELGCVALRKVTVTRLRFDGEPRSRECHPFSQATAGLPAGLAAAIIAIGGAGAGNAADTTIQPASPAGKLPQAVIVAGVPKAACWGERKA